MLKVRRAQEAYFAYTFRWRKIMKKIFILMLSLTLLFAFSGCSMQSEKYTVYFSSDDGKSMVEEAVSIEENLSLEKTVYAVMEKLLEGPYRAEHKKAVPPDTALLGVRLEGKNVTVNLSQDFEKTIGPAERLMAIYSVVNTLCAIDGINKVQILVNGRKLNYTASDEEIGALSMYNVISVDEIGRNQKTGAEAEKKYVRVDLFKPVAEQENTFEARMFIVAVEVSSVDGEGGGVVRVTGNLNGVGDFVAGVFNTGTRTFTEGTPVVEDPEAGTEEPTE